MITCLIQLFKEFQKYRNNEHRVCKYAALLIKQISNFETSSSQNSYGIFQTLLFAPPRNYWLTRNTFISKMHYKRITKIRVKQYFVHERNGSSTLSRKQRITRRSGELSASKCSLFRVDTTFRCRDTYVLPSKAKSNFRHFTLSSRCYHRIFHSRVFIDLT